MSNRQKLMGHLYAIFTTLVWGSCFVLTKVMLTAYTPTQIIPLRMGLAYLALWALRPKTMKLPWKDELMFILIGITGGSFYFFLQNTASAHTSAANVSILVSMSPILTVILAQLFSRRGEKLGKWVYIGAVVAIAGVVMVVLNGTLSFHLSPLGDLLALAAALMWAVYSILVKKYTERYDNFLVTRRVFLWAFLTSLPLVLLTDGLPSLTPLFTQPNILVSWLFLGRVRQRRVLRHLEHRLQAAGRGHHQQLPLCHSLRHCGGRLAAAGGENFPHVHHRCRPDHAGCHLRREVGFLSIFAVHFFLHRGTPVRASLFSVSKKPRRVCRPQAAKK